MDVSFIRTELFYIILIGAIVFSQLIGKDTGSLIAIIIVTLWGMISIYFLYQRSDKLKKTADTPNVYLKKEIDERIKNNPQVSSSISYYIGKLKTSGLKYIINKNELVQIAYDLRWIKMFDKGRYDELIILMDKMQKVYMYILAGRYYVSSYLSTFNDIRKEVTENLYSFYVITPKALRHVYGLDPLKNLEKNINDFNTISEQMAVILESYAKHEVKEAYIPDRNPYPANTYLSNHIAP